MVLVVLVVGFSEDWVVTFEVVDFCVVVGGPLLNLEKTVQEIEDL